jgi:hypothetical protein
MKRVASITFNNFLICTRSMVITIVARRREQCIDFFQRLPRRLEDNQ